MAAWPGRNAIAAGLRRILQSPLERERAFYRRYRELSETIEAAPDDMIALVLRGELSLERGEGKRAEKDFERALALLEGMDENEGWALVEQVMRDRALYGLRLAKAGA